MQSATSNLLSVLVLSRYRKYDDKKKETAPAPMLQTIKAMQHGIKVLPIGN